MMKSFDIDEAVRTVEWWQQLKETTVPKFRPLFFDEHRFLVLKGGGGSGKSIFAGRKVLERAATEPGHRILVCRKVANTIRESCFKQLVGQAYDHYAEQVDKVNRGDMLIRLKNGSEIIFAGLDDVNKLKSIYNITSVWIEEAAEITEADFNQIDIRLRGETAYYQQIIISFNPVSILHWLKRRFFDQVDKDGKLLPQKERDKIRTHESTYLDNPFLPEENRETLEAFKYTDEYYYTVYCLGEWGITGKSVFDAQAVTRRLLSIPKAEDKGVFDYVDYGTGLKGIKWRSDKDGFITIYEKVVQYRHYVIGGDTAGNGSDSFVAQVLDNLTGVQVCIMRHCFDEDLYAKQVYCLGLYYNEALIAIETNFSTYPVMELERLRYPRQYVRESIDEYTHSVKKSFGFQTNTKTRPVIIAGLIGWVRENVDTINDRTTLEEMLTFVRDESYKPTAEEGAHDDCVMSLAIAHYVRPQQKYLDEREPERETVWTKDMLEDYRRANAEGKAMLEKMWGKPKV